MYNNKIYKLIINRIKFIVNSELMRQKILFKKKTSCSNVQEVIYIYELLFFGKIKFNIIAVIVASTTGDLPKIVVTQDGKVASAAFA